VSDEIKTALDLRGLLCPMPVVKLAKAVKGMAVGELVQATASDPGVLADIPAWCKSTGNELVKMEKGDKVFTFVVRKLAG
jgi:tRNA 2-thiouridine synthesizing protein A